jgi:hypothetical protein
MRALKVRADALVASVRPARQPGRYFVITLAVASDFGQMISKTPLRY